MRVAALLRSGLVLLVLLSSVATASEASEVISPETVRSLAESMRLDTGLRYFHVAFLLHDVVCASSTNRTVFIDTQTGEILEQFSQGEVGRVIGVSPNRDLIAIYTSSQSVEIWTVTPLERTKTLGVLEDADWPRSSFSSDQRLLSVVNRWNEIDVWDLEQVKLIHQLSGHASNLFDLTFSPDGRLLASGGGGSSRDDRGESFICIWYTESGALLETLPTEDVGDNHALTFTRDGARLISTGIFRMLAWDTSTWERVYDSGPSYPGSYGIALSPDGSLLAIATDARRIRLVNVEEMRTVRDIFTGAEVIDVDFSEDGTKLAGSFIDGTVRIWEIP